MLEKTLFIRDTVLFVIDVIRFSVFNLKNNVNKLTNRSTPMILNLMIKSY